MTEPSTIGEVIDAGRSWDTYWAYLISNNSYYSLVYDKSDIIKSPLKNLNSVDPLSFYSTQLIHTKSGLPARVSAVYAHGSEIVNKKVVEIGAGLGLVAQGIAFHAKHYLGVDASRMAVHITNNIATSNMKFYHISQTREIYDLRGTFDTAIIMNVLVHQNYSHAMSTLNTANQLLKKGGVVRCNFCNIKIEEAPLSVFPSDKNINLGAISAGFWYDDDEIKELANLTGFELVEIKVEKTLNARMVHLVKL